MGVARQLTAILASGSRREKLAGVAVPTLVIHGRADPLVPLACGVDTAEAVPGARLEVIDGMGHDLPPALWERLIDLISSTPRAPPADPSAVGNRHPRTIRTGTAMKPSPRLVFSIDDTVLVPAFMQTTRAAERDDGYPRGDAHEENLELGLPGGLDVDPG